MGIPLLRGRDFGPQDERVTPTSQTGQSPRAAIIDETTAQKLFGDENPVGRLLRADGSWPPLEIIGVVRDVVHKGLRDGTRVSIYGLPSLQESNRRYVMIFFYVRTVGDPLALARGIRQIVHEVDPKARVTDLRTMNDLLNDQLFQERSLSSLVGFFSLLALALACLGLYGTLSYAVVRRTREIGVRMALGAQEHDVLSVVIRQGMTLTLIGCGLGAILAVALTRVVSSLLYGVTPTDPLTFVLTVLLLGAVAFVSCWLPARRAARIDPMVALRYE
jgi:putative ABC transport system permease protein